MSNNILDSLGKQMSDFWEQVASKQSPTSSQKGHRKSPHSSTASSDEMLYFFALSAIQTRDVDVLLPPDVSTPLDLAPPPPSRHAEFVDRVFTGLRSFQPIDLSTFSGFSMPGASRRQPNDLSSLRLRLLEVLVSLSFDDEMNGVISNVLRPLCGVSTRQFAALQQLYSGVGKGGGLPRELCELFLGLVDKPVDTEEGRGARRMLLSLGDLLGSMVTTERGRDLIRQGVSLSNTPDAILTSNAVDELREIISSERLEHLPPSISLELLCELLRFRFDTSLEQFSGVAHDAITRIATAFCTTASISTSDFYACLLISDWELFLSYFQGDSKEIQGLSVFTKQLKKTIKKCTLCDQEEISSTASFLLLSTLKSPLVSFLRFPPECVSLLAESFVLSRKMSGSLDPAGELCSLLRLSLTSGDSFPSLMDMSSRTELFLRAGEEFERIRGKYLSCFSPFFNASDVLSCTFSELVLSIAAQVPAPDDLSQLKSYSEALHEFQLTVSSIPGLEPSLATLSMDFLQGIIAYVPELVTPSALLNAKISKAKSPRVDARHNFVTDSLGHLDHSLRRFLAVQWGDAGMPSGVKRRLGDLCLVTATAVVSALVAGELECEELESTWRQMERLSEAFSGRNWPLVPTETALEVVLSGKDKIRSTLLQARLVPSLRQLFWRHSLLSTSASSERIERHIGQISQFIADSGVGLDQNEDECHLEVESYEIVASVCREALLGPKSSARDSIFRTYSQSEAVISLLKQDVTTLKRSFPCQGLKNLLKMVTTTLPMASDMLRQHLQHLKKREKFGVYPLDQDTIQAVLLHREE